MLMAAGLPQPKPIKGLRSGGYASTASFQRIRE
jgi:hypothetical protein